MRVDFGCRGSYISLLGALEWAASAFHVPRSRCHLENQWASSSTPPPRYVACSQQRLRLLAASSWPDAGALHCTTCCAAPSLHQHRDSWLNTYAATEHAYAACWGAGLACHTPGTSISHHMPSIFHCAGFTICTRGAFEGQQGCAARALDIHGKCRAEGPLDTGSCRMAQTWPGSEPACVAALMACACLLSVSSTTRSLRTVSAFGGPAWPLQR